MVTADESEPAAAPAPEPREQPAVRLPQRLIVQIAALAAMDMRTVVKVLRHPESVRPSSVERVGRALRQLGLVAPAAAPERKP